MSNDILLEVKNLKVEFQVRRGTVRALDGVNFTIRRGQTMGIIGESGSGKSVTARAIMQLLAKNGRIADGEIIFHQPSHDGSNHSTPINMTTLDPDGDAVRKLRGGEIAMIFQEPMSSLTPVYTTGTHIGEAVQLHLKPHRKVANQMGNSIRKQHNVSKKEARDIAIELLDRVGIPRAHEQVDSYPHQLSGGQRQRVMIAVALSCNPSLLIADEPTTALDVTTQAQINDLMLEIQEEYNMAIMYITHDLGVIAEVAQDVAVMYMGRIVEIGDIDSLFYNAKHPYTTSLLASIPRIGQVRRRRLEAIKGMVPDPFNVPSGCAFRNRCYDYMDGVCDKNVPALEPINDNQASACFLHHRVSQSS